MKIVFLGTPEFAVLPLKSIIASKHEVVAVVTKLDKKVGRKQIVTPSPIKVVAMENGIKVLQYKSLKLEGVEELKALNIDLMVTCAFGQILNEEVLNCAKHGVINIHASLLPKYRGSSPIQWSILNGDSLTGITIMQTEVGIDTGDMIAKRSIEIDPNENAEQLFEKLSLLASEFIVGVIDSIENGTAVYQKQDDSLATHVKMIEKTDGEINFNQTAKNVHNKVRAFNPWPCCYTFLNGEQLKIWKTTVNESVVGRVGEVVKADKFGLVVACGEGGLNLLEVQTSGGKRLDFKSFLAGNKILVGDILGEKC